MSQPKQIGPSPLGTAPIKGLIWRFAIPGVISQLVTAVYNIVDQIYVGWGIGELGIAATTVVFPMASIIMALSLLFGSGAAANFSLLMGAKKEDEARKTIGNALMLMVLCGVIIAACSILCLKPLLYAFGATDLIMPYAVPYMLIICIGIPFGIFSTGAAYYIRSDGSPNFSSAVLLAGAIFNIIFDPIFLYTFDMGIEGIALATTLGQVLSSLLVMYYLLRKSKMVKLVKSDLYLQPHVIKAICGLGVAAFAQHLLAMIVQIVSANTLKYYGAMSVYGSEISIAAAGAVSKAMIVFMSCVIGISLGCQPIYGFNYGGKKYDRVKEAYTIALRYGIAVSVTTFLIFQFFPRQILSLFGSGNPLFYEFATKYIRIYLFMTFINALQPITSPFFTSLGKAYVGLALSLLRQGLLLLPLLLILPRFYGIDGMLFAGPIADAIAAVVVIICGVKEIRKLTKMQAEQS